MENKYNLIHHFIYESSNIEEVKNELGNDFSPSFFEELISKNLLLKNEDGTFIFNFDHEKFKIGRFRANPKGFGFVSSLNEMYEDMYVDNKNTLHSINDDIVLFTTHDSTVKKGMTEAKVVELVHRTNSKFVASIYVLGNDIFAKPDNSKMNFNIELTKNNDLKLVEGHKVVIEIIDSKDGKFTGEVVELIGHKNDPGVDILSVIYDHNINIDFSTETMIEANDIPDTINPSDYPNRVDLRGETIITIDGDDSKDLDDAISLKRFEGDKFNLSVHIADVSHYIPVGSSLDDDAYERGTSVYLVDRVIPMIPHSLSNGICSLNPQVDRLALTCDMIFDKKGNLVDYKFYESIIKTTERMTYNNVTKILQNDYDLKEQYKHIYADLKLMEEFSNILRKKRVANGSIDFDVKEAKLVLDELGKVVDITFRDRTVSEMMIEDFMLAANETVASHFAKNKIPFVYRIHEKPNPKKVDTLTNFLSTYGHNLSIVDGSIDIFELQKVLKETSSLEEGSVIGRLALRSMQQAKYSPENAGHYGLSIKDYTHFTSPIRRYPDLMVHRLIKNDLANPSNPEHFESIEYLLQACEQSSTRERRAIACERDVMELKKSEFMSDKVNHEYEGIISSVTKFGMFVELPNTVEGLVHIKNLGDDHFIYDDKNMSFFGKRTRQRYSIGDKVLVKLVNIDNENHKLDFQILKVIHSPYKEFVSRLKKKERNKNKKFNDRSKTNYKKNNKEKPYKNSKSKNENLNPSNSFAKDSRKNKFDSLYGKN